MSDQPTNPALPNAPATDADGYIGELDEQARVAISALQRQQGEVINQLGQVEIHKAQLIERHNALQMEAKRILDAEAIRLGIPQGKAWRITSEGKVKLA